MSDYVKKTGNEIKEGARMAAEMLIMEGYEPEDVLAAFMNGTIVLAKMVKAQSGYIANQGISLLLSQQGQERESIDLIEQRQAEADELRSKQKLADEAELSAKSGGAENVSSIFKNK